MTRIADQTWKAEVDRQKDQWLRGYEAGTRNRKQAIIAGIVGYLIGHRGSTLGTIFSLLFVYCVIYLAFQHWMLVTGVIGVIVTVKVARWWWNRPDVPVIRYSPEETKF